MQKPAQTLSLVRRLAALALLALVLGAGPSLTLYLHSCRIMGTEVRLERSTTCCWAQASTPSELPTLRRAACCDDHAAHFGADLTYSTSPAPAVPSPELMAVALQPIELRLAAAFVKASVQGRAPPTLPAAPSGRERRIVLASFLI